jgi:hypothetical protein
LVIGIVSIFTKPTINLNKYLDVSFEGYDTIGKAVVTFDTERFEKDYEKKLSSKVEETDGYMDGEAYLESLFNYYDSDSASGAFLSGCVSGTIDKDSGLSNGDTVTYTWNCNDEYALDTYGYKLKYEDVEYTVKGLEEAETFDPFDGIEIVFSGVSPNGSASVEGMPTANAAQDLSYVLDVYDGLSNGDTVTATVSLYYDDDPIEYCIENYGKIPSPLTKEYTVEGLDSYIRSASDISEDALKAMQEQAEDVYHADVAQTWGNEETLKSLKYMGNYLLTSKNSDDYGSTDNILYLVYKAKVNDKYSNNGKTYNKTIEVYWYICYYNLLFNSDGVTTVDTLNYSTPNDRFTIDSGVSTGWSTKSWYYYGYQSLNELYKSVVTSKVDSYNHEDNVDESVSVTESEEEDEEEVMGEDGIIFPNSSSELVDASEVEALTDEELRYAINELYARHGYIFKDDTLRAYYEQYDWYDPTVKPDDFTIALFNDVEKENIDIMQKERSSRQ